MARYDTSTQVGRIEYLTRLIKNTIPNATVNGITAVVSCAMQESGVDPTNYECRFLGTGISPIDPNTPPTFESIFAPNGYTWQDFIRWYNYADLNEAFYTNNFEQPVTHYLGMGLWQWTGSRTRNLYKWCQANNYKPFSFEGQLAFAMGGEGSPYKDIFINTVTSNDTVENLINYYGGEWEGNSGAIYKYQNNRALAFGTVEEELKNGKGNHTLKSTGTANADTQPNNDTALGTTLGTNLAGIFSGFTPENDPQKADMEKVLKLFENIIKDFLKIFNKQIFKLNNSTHYQNDVFWVTELFNTNMLKIRLNQKYIKELFKNFTDELTKTLVVEAPKQPKPKDKPTSGQHGVRPQTPNANEKPQETPLQNTGIPKDVREACDYYRSLGGQSVGTAYYEGVAQCYGLTSEYTNRLGFGVLTTGTASRQPNAPVFGDGNPGWYACDIGADFNWSAKGWKVVFNPKKSDIRVGAIFNVKPYAPFPPWGTWYAGHTGLISNYGGGVVEITEQNGGLAPGAISVSQQKDDIFINGMASFVYPPNVY